MSGNDGITLRANGRDRRLSGVRRQGWRPSAISLLVVCAGAPSSAVVGATGRNSPGGLTQPPAARASFADDTADACADRVDAISIGEHDVIGERTVLGARHPVGDEVGASVPPVESPLLDATAAKDGDRARPTSLDGKTSPTVAAPSAPRTSSKKLASSKCECPAPSATNAPGCVSRTRRTEWARAGCHHRWASTNPRWSIILTNASKG